MGYEIRDQQARRDNLYQELKSRRVHIEKLIQNWVDDANSLHADSKIDDKGEVLAQKAGMTATIKLKLGL